MRRGAGVARGLHGRPPALHADLGQLPEALPHRDGPVRELRHVLGQYDSACDGTKLQCRSPYPCCKSCSSGVNEFACAGGVDVGVIVSGSCDKPTTGPCK